MIQENDKFNIPKKYQEMSATELKKGMIIMSKWSNKLNIK